MAPHRIVQADLRLRYTLHVAGTLSFQERCVPVRSCSSIPDYLVGQVVKASASIAEDLGLKSRLQQDFCRSNHTSDFKIGTPVVTLPGAWRYRVNAGSAWCQYTVTG